MEDYSRAIGDLTNALQQKPDAFWIPQIYSLRAYGYKLQGDWQKSVADLNSALNAEPAGATSDQVRLLIDRGYAYLQLGKPALALDPSSRDAMEHRNRLQRKLEPGK